jgi:hypothetical protein
VERKNLGRNSKHITISFQVEIINLQSLIRLKI